MARTLVAKKRKFAQKKAAKPTATEFVVVGTYKDRQRAWIEKNGVYNYPVREGDDFNDAALRAVKELWLYADVKSTQYAFAVTGYLGKMSKAEFIAKYPSYAKLPSPKPSVKSSSSKNKISVLTKSENRAYYVFEVTKLDYKPTVNTEIFIARTADFGKRSAKVKKAIAQFKADGEFAPLSAYLPKDLSQVPPKQLRVSECGFQTDFFDELMPVVAQALSTEGKKIRLATVFSGIGAIEQALLRTHVDHEIVFACDNGDQSPFVCGAIDWKECVAAFYDLSKQVDGLKPVTESQRWSVKMLRQQRDTIQALLNGAPAMSKRPERELKDRVHMLYEAVGFFKFRVGWEAEGDWGKRKQLVDMLYRPLLGRNKVRQSYMANYPVPDDRFQLAG